MPPILSSSEPLWWLTRDGDKDCLRMYERHYSSSRTTQRARIAQFVGPGDKVVLRFPGGESLTAMFVWRKFTDDCIDERTGEKQTGVNCAVFRNEGPELSSEFIRQADAIADCLWADRRHYTYVNAARIKSANPGYCFLVAGWRRCGRTKGGLIVMERVTEQPESGLRGDPVVREGQGNV